MINVPKPSMIVATDLDGTLLDHYSYSWQAAKPSIDVLRALGAQIVINTSKTFAEVTELQAALNLDAPFIVENGSAIYAPSGVATDAYQQFNDRYSRIVLGAERADVVAKVYTLRDRHKWSFEGYNDWDIGKVIEHTGLDEVSAAKSLQRQFSEPLLWRDSDASYKDFCDAIHACDLRVIRGGRFIHILGKSNKGSSLLALKKLTEHTGSETLLICLGDSYNDLDMLEIADLPVFVRSPVHDFPAHNCNSTPIFTDAFGPEGWHEAITQILDTHSIMKP
ncbi:MAG: mannosyl-3-phosphoglycerate phosphatase [Flavobacteriales bacterium]|jgi:mannosyl-3-phosphoglycerate phosphatase